MMRLKGSYRDTCGSCTHFARDHVREREQVEIWPWMAGFPVHKCDVHGQVVESLDSPNACMSAADGCVDFERRGRRR